MWWRPHAPAAIIEAVERTFGGLNVLVNAAGIIGTGTVENTTDEAWDQMLDVNLRAPFRLMRAAVPLLTQSRGAIVNVSSVTGTRSFPGVLSYCVSKAGVDQLTRCAALELAAKGDSRQRRQSWRRYFKPAPPQRHDRRELLGVSGAIEGDAPAGARRTDRGDRRSDRVSRVGQGGWITGETVAIDGGRHLTCAR